MTEQSTGYDSGILSWFKSLFESDEPECKHVEHCKGVDDTFPDGSASIWYVLDESRDDDPRWSETDVAYLKLQDVATEYVCLGCGETRTIHSAERVGGEDGIKLKEEMGDEELAEFSREVHGGAFYNGFPSDHALADGGAKYDTETDQQDGESA